MWRAALVFFDRADRAGEVIDRLRNIGPWAGKTFHDCNKGVHEASEIDLDRLVEDTDKLSQKLRRIK